jgi:tetratricopeptide (TPR) repeat protein
MDLRRTNEAVAHFQAALAQDPDFVEAANHLGGAMLALDRLEEAQYWFTYALARAPDHAQARFGTAMALLAQGDFAQGWPAYEARLQDTPPQSPAPRWDGSTQIAGRSILLLAEQGLGDTIQFARYATLLRQRGARILLQCPPTLAGLLAPVVDAVVPPGAPPPPHDLHAPLMSLPMALDTRLDSIPAETPYLHPDPARKQLWAARIGPATRPRVGIAWAGSPAHPEDDLRSLPATLLLDALAGAAVELHAVQPEDHAVAGLDIVTHGAALTDFTETAALLAQLDLVITVDTSVAHLAGAMALPTWVLLQFSADFRWLRGRDDSPWYPGMRLFRQTAPGDWSGVLAAVASALSEHVAQRQIGAQRQ